MESFSDIDGPGASQAVEDWRIVAVKLIYDRQTHCQSCHHSPGWGWGGRGRGWWSTAPSWGRSCSPTWSRCEGSPCCRRWLARGGRWRGRWGRRGPPRPGRECGTLRSENQVRIFLYKLLKWGKRARKEKLWGFMSVVWTVNDRERIWTHLSCWRRRSRQLEFSRSEPSPDRRVAALCSCWCDPRRTWRQSPPCCSPLQTNRLQKFPFNPFLHRIV